MRFEVENKYPVDDLAAVQSRLRQLGAAETGCVTQRDVYFAHPARDFTATDEALRLRQTLGDRQKHAVTYKGPKLDAATKTRREIEFPLVPEAAAGFAELLAALGFREVAVVEKTRRQLQLAHERSTAEIALDEVAGLGAFVEIELQATAETLDAARAALARIAADLGLAQIERKSYLELLLEGKRTETITPTGRS